MLLSGQTYYMDLVLLQDNEHRSDSSIQNISQLRWFYWRCNTVAWNTQTRIKIDKKVLIAISKKANTFETNKITTAAFKMRIMQLNSHQIVKDFDKLSQFPIYIHKWAAHSYLKHQYESESIHALGRSHVKNCWNCTQGPKTTSLTQRFQISKYFHNIKWYSK